MKTRETDSVPQLSVSSLSSKKNRKGATKGTTAKVLFAFLALGAVSLSGCTEMIGMMGEGLAGGLLGAGTGAIIGHQSGCGKEGALAGALIGHMLGGAVENQKMRSGIAAANTMYVMVPGSDGQTYRQVVLVRHPSGWMSQETGEIFPTPPSPAYLSSRGYGPR